MGYHLTILRSSHGKQLPISLDEARAAALELGWEYTDTPPTFSLTVPEGTVQLWHDDHALWTKNPEEWGMTPLVEFANALQARVRGEEFESYGANGEVCQHPDDVLLKQEAEQASGALLAQSRREQQRIRNVFVGFFIVLGVLGYVIGKSLENR
ncbi:hypothetical protein G4G28_22720 [Massilia sp. Dwa41.01b]|uniref:PASTA domain-containing protein n=1 Tax=unclassified Massilia TaxID=2609279 RepID=UPI0016048687|nr:MULTISPECIES: PASTA domain-containing protein [unclassified Massilia]QNA90618.1 hypothetical protein G4G28_22720 [Massilia sp. Dwa41.01b]QNA97848.1 hypothetical protein G4G31_01800 [Massilia sp. Se16.2.3]